MDVIVTQNGQAIWNFSDISRLHVTGNGTGIQAVAKNGAGGEVAKYKHRDQCTMVLSLLESEIREGSRTFVFPSIEALDNHMHHSSSGGGKRHGGS